MTRVWRLIGLSLLAGAFLLASSATGQADSAFDALFDAGKPIIDLRVRFESVNQDNRPEIASGLTGRARLGFQTGELHGLSALVDFDLVDHLGPQNYFDSIGGRSPARFPTIADPDMVTLNRAQLMFAAPLSSGAHEDAVNLQIVVGRQRIVFGDARLIGNAGWRQHEQTFDAVLARTTIGTDATFTYAYVAGVNRVFGPDSPMGTLEGDSHLFNATYGGIEHLKIEAYAYLLDLEEAPTQSTATYGVRAEGTLDLGMGFSAILNAAYARQLDYASNPLRIDLSYYLLEIGVGYGGGSLVAGREVLEGNGTIGFQTPLATLHAFQGWAETFLVKPPAGVEDSYLKARYGFALPPLSDKVTATVVYHDFAAENVTADFGTELDLMLEAKLDAHVLVGAAAADYRGAGPFPDKSVLWIYLGYTY